nr:hypothetical protein Iba_chr02bCG22560 [Ipomoea batatas]
MEEELMQGMGCGEDTMRIRDPKPSCPSPPYPQPQTCPISENFAEKDKSSIIHNLEKIVQNMRNSPDRASVCLPPAATLTTLTPGFNVTKHGSAERLSSFDEELSAACLDDDTRLLFAPSSTPLLTDTAPAVDPDPWKRGLTVIM